MTIRITSRVEIPNADVTFEYSRGSGPGGQHVNKVSTRATLCFDLEGTAGLNPMQKSAIRSILHSRISRTGILRVTSRRFRSRSANERAAIERFVELLVTALTPRKPRVASRPSRGVKERRLQEKKRRADVKRMRQRPGRDG